MNFEFCHVKQMHDGESSWKQRTTKEHNLGDARPRVRQSLRIVVPKLCEDFSSRSRKVEEECTPFRGRKGHGCEGVSKPPRHLFRGALNFPRLNRSTAVMVVWCFLSLLLSMRVRRKVAKAHISYTSIYTVRGRDVKGVKVAASRRIEFLLNGLPRRRSLSKFMFWK